MKGLYRLRRKMHYLVNVAFYGLFFAVGYLVGSGFINENIIQKIIEFF